MKPSTRSKIYQIAIWLILFGLIVLAAGCASENIKPKLAVKVIAPIESKSDWYLHSNRSWVCDPPKVLFEGGWEHRNGWEWGGYHWSSVLCGTGNTKPEMYENGLYLGYTFGGFK